MLDRLSGLSESLFKKRELWRNKRSRNNMRLHLSICATIHIAGRSQFCNQARLSGDSTRLPGSHRVWAKLGEAVSDSMSLELPAVHSFPPFFTRQPNQETFKSQQQQWSAIILVYYKFHQKYRLSLTPETLSSDLFTNKNINRSLKLDTLRDIVDHMVSEGHAEYSSKKKEEALIYWRRPDEWAQLLSRHVENTGQNNSVLTIYELTEADEAKNSEFWQMDKAMLRKVVDVLAKKGKAVIMKGNDGEEQGIKFL